MRGLSPSGAAVERELFRARSPVQEIVLYEGPGGTLELVLEGVCQFHSAEEAAFHEVLVDPAMILAPRIEEVLILGGGDGLALRNVLRYREVRRVVLCEIDAKVVEMARTVPGMVALTEGALSDPRVELVIDDALDFVDEARERFDVIVCDFPACTDAALEPLFSAELYARLAALGSEDLLVSVQVSQDPPGFWRVCRNIERSFPWTVPLLARLDPGGATDAEESWADFVLATRGPRAAVRPLAANLRFLTAERLDRLRILDRDDTRFSTTEYGTAPDFG
jgi:spermidine synthase